MTDKGDDPPTRALLLGAIAISLNTLAKVVHLTSSFPSFEINFLSPKYLRNTRVTLQRAPLRMATGPQALRAANRLLRPNYEPSHRSSNIDHLVRRRLVTTQWMSIPLCSNRSAQMDPPPGFASWRCLHLVRSLRPLRHPRVALGTLDPLYSTRP